MIHIVFNEIEVELMNKVIELDDTLSGKVVQVRDDFAVGPLSDLDSNEGWAARFEWWHSLLAGSPYSGSVSFEPGDRQTVNELKDAMNADESEEIWIWMGQNQHDVCGYYWLMPQLKNFQGRVMILYMNNLPFINEKGQLFYPSWLHEIQPKEFLKARKLARPITTSEFEIDPDEWKRICGENSMVRILEGGKKIRGTEEDFYDEDILRNITGEWQKATRVLTNTLHRMKIKTGDLFLMWRMKQLISAGKIQVMGEMEKGWKEFDVKLPGQNEIIEASSESETSGS
jgi:hypothetical protein